MANPNKKNWIRTVLSVQTLILFFEGFLLNQESIKDSSFQNKGQSASKLIPISLLGGNFSSQKLYFYLQKILKLSVYSVTGTVSDPSSDCSPHFPKAPRIARSLNKKGKLILSQNNAEWKHKMDRVVSVGIVFLIIFLLLFDFIFK